MLAYNLSNILLGPLFLGAFWVHIFAKTYQNAAKSRKL